MEKNITLREVFAIENIISAEHCSNNYQLPSWETPYEEAFAGETWSDCADSGGGKHGEKTTGKEFSGVCSSLVKKGWAFTSGSGREKAIGITKEGWEAYQSWAKENLAK